MSNTREKLNRVKPTKALIILGPMPCEQQAAAIRNKTVDAMSNQKTDVVAYRYLQSRQGRYNTAIEASLYTLLGLVNLWNIYSLLQPNEDDQNTSNNLVAIFPAILFLYCVGNILPNIANTKRYAETASGCEEWLQKRISEKCLKDITQIGYPSNFSKGTLSTLGPVLRSHDVETVALSDKLENRRRFGKRI